MGLFVKGERKGGEGMIGYLLVRRVTWVVFGIVGEEFELM
jgi:hypothetical protein